MINNSTDSTEWRSLMMMMIISLRFVIGEWLCLVVWQKKEKEQTNKVHCHHHRCAVLMIKECGCCTLYYRMGTLYSVVLVVMLYALMMVWLGGKNRKGISSSSSPEGGEWGGCWMFSRGSTFHSRCVYSAVSMVHYIHVVCPYLMIVWRKRVHFKLRFNIWEWLCASRQPINYFGVNEQPETRWRSEMIMIILNIKNCSKVVVHIRISHQI